MAADPIGLLIAATIPADIAETIEQLADGIGQAARDAGAPIVGGDLTGGDRISLTMTVLGTAKPPIGRSTAKVGDRVWITGRLGGPGACLRRHPSFRNCRQSRDIDTRAWSERKLVGKDGAGSRVRSDSQDGGTVGRPGPAGGR